MITVHNKFKLGDFVYVIHDDEHKRMILGIEVYLDGSFLYKVAGGGKNEYAQERELQESKEYEVTSG